MRVLFAGTPEVAVPTLTALLASQHDVVGVLTRADAPAGRGKKLTPSPVRVAAEAAGLPVITGNPGALETQAAIAELRAEVAAVVAYGHLLRPTALELLPLGWFNLPFSLLPRWRGAAPVQWSLINGDAEAGLTVFRLDAGMDTGPIYAQQTYPLTGDETTGTLLPQLAELGAKLVVRVFDELAAGAVVGTAQTGLATVAPKITTEQAQVDWSRHSGQIANLIRGVTPDPGAWTTLWLPGAAPIRLGLGPVTPIPSSVGSVPPLSSSCAQLATPSGWPAETQDLSAPTPELAPGEIRVLKREVQIGTGDGAVRLSIVQPPGKKPMPATDWARGARLTPAARLSSSSPRG